MQLAVPHRLFDRLVMVLGVLLLTAPVTFLEVAHPSVQTLRADFQNLTARLPYAPSQPAPAPKPKPQAAKAHTTTPAATKPATTTSTTTTTSTAATPAVATATTNSFVHLRAAKSVSSQIITNLNAGTPVQLRDDADATWQGVTYQGKSGYIYRAYLQYQPASATP